MIHLRPTSVRTYNECDAREPLERGETLLYLAALARPGAACALCPALRRCAVGCHYIRAHAIASRDDAEW